MIDNYRFKTKPFEHQKEALKKSWAAKTYALLYGNGYR